MELFNLNEEHIPVFNLFFLFFTFSLFLLQFDDKNTD